MRLTTVAVAVTASAFALVGAANTSAQQTGASLELAGVPVSLTIPGSFTMTVSGSTGAASHASIYAIYGPAPCAASVDAQLEAGPDESLISPEAAEVPVFGLAGDFTVRAHGLGEAVTSPGIYTVCVFMEALEESEVGETLEEEEVIAVASATFTVLPPLTSVSLTAITTGGVKKCVVPRIKGRRPRPAKKAIGRAHCAVVTKCLVPHIRGRRLRSAEKAIARAHCAVGKVKRADSRHVGKGRVIWQNRRPGKLLPRGTRVSFIVSNGVSRRSASTRICAGAPHRHRHRLRCSKDGRQ